METPQDKVLQTVGLSELLLLSPYPIFLNPIFMALVEMIILVESATARTEQYKQNNLDQDCPAMIEYSPQWAKVQEEITARIKTLNGTAKVFMTDLGQLISDFEYSRTKVIAACPKKDCQDRESAQEELGWKEGEEVLQ